MILAFGCLVPVAAGPPASPHATPFVGRPKGLALAVRGWVDRPPKRTELRPMERHFRAPECSRLAACRLPRIPPPLTPYSTEAQTRRTLILLTLRPGLTQWPV